ncbi:hypothetical protein [Marinobacter sp. ST-43]|uniref:hypothetical protein n=1 Tax=Marinobacter sp. ST-43 TaxID=3050453 RepID=UPI0026DFBEF8|nr:hypothetical protein [Marinobacter sp. ST-43]
MTHRDRSEYKTDSSVMAVCKPVTIPGMTGHVRRNTQLESNLIEQVRPLTVQLYEGALKAAQRQVSETSRELKQLRSEIEAEILDANTIIEDLEQRLAETTQRLLESAEELKQSHEARYQFERQAITLEAEVNQLRENSTYEELMKRIIALESKGENG